MSNLVFPLKAAGCVLEGRAPYTGVRTDEALAGNELRSTWWLSQRRRYSLKFSALRSGQGTPLDYQQVASMFDRHFGELDSFLLQDPEDNAVTDMGFALGDGATTSFQLQRTVGGDIIDASGNVYHQTTKPYTNLLKNSSFETDSNADGLADNWADYNDETATVPNRFTTIPGLNGGKAQRVSWGTPSAAAQKHGVSQASLPLVSGQWYTVSFLARASGAIAGQSFLLPASPSPAQSIAVSNPALSSAWQRYAFQIVWTLGTSVDTTLRLTVGGSATGIWGDLDFDLVQVTTGQFGVSDLQPFETPAAATGTANPAYWPLFSDGFSPVYEMNGSPTIYQDGDWMGRRQLYPSARTNLLPFSEQLDNAAWSKQAVTITANATTAPDGTTTAEQISEGTTTNAHYTLEADGGVTGELRCRSIFVKANTLPFVSWWDNGSSNGGVIFNLGTGAISTTFGSALASGVQTSPLWPGWLRIWFTYRVAATPGSAVLMCENTNSFNETYLGTSRTFYAWGAMSERVSDLNGPTPYIKTPAGVAVTVTDFTIGSLGTVTIATAPPSGSFLSWTGSYYIRVRWDDAKGLSLARIVSKMWSTGIALVSVKPAQ